MPLNVGHSGNRARGANAERAPLRVHRFISIAGSVPGPNAPPSLELASLAASTTKNDFYADLNAAIFSPLGLIAHAVRDETQDLRNSSLQVIRKLPAAKSDCRQMGNVVDLKPATAILLQSKASRSSQGRPLNGPMLQNRLKFV